MSTSVITVNGDAIRVGGLSESGYGYIHIGGVPFDTISLTTSADAHRLLEAVAIVHDAMCMREAEAALVAQTSVEIATEESAR